MLFLSDGLSRMDVRPRMHPWRNSEVAFAACQSRVLVNLRLSRKSYQMPLRKAHARWEGSLREGKGQIDFGDGLFKGSLLVHFALRGRKGHEPGRAAGRSPCELLRDGAIADARQGGLPARLRRRERAMSRSRRRTGASRLPPSHLTCKARVTGIDHGAFVQIRRCRQSGLPGVASACRHRASRSTRSSRQRDLGCRSARASYGRTGR